MLFMLSVSHAATGAFIATKLPHPALYIPLILASHYLEDWIPHWDVGTGLSNGTRSRKTAFILELVDLAVALLLVYFFWQAGQSVINYHAWIGVFISLTPDFFEAPRNFLRSEPWFLQKINQFHGWFHHSIPRVAVGLLPQIVLLLVIWLFRWNPHDYNLWVSPKCRGRESNPHEVASIGFWDLRVYQFRHLGLN